MAGSASRLPIAGPGRHKVIANGLRELDRFLSVMIDEIARLTPGNIDTTLLARQRNTANKLRALYTAMGRPRSDHDRLRALARSRDCLFYCDGIVSRSDERHGAAMTVGWPGGADTPTTVLHLGEKLEITAEDLAWICCFYDRVATDLMDVEEVRFGARLIIVPV
ncbi:hypothetical protein SAMN06295912_12042 [Sphingomonas laterariae]|uniref:Uncharacterized protein n=2 Tax=Edaphosphingomonas laterariae TaxID=861865 RepID=A0A239I0N2_9SPHN|nr:hypothetical protein SAMN06295912_12042 [Sphingomonas laterariae]